MNWSSWYSFNEGNITNLKSKLSEKAGVYCFKVEKRGKFLPIKRVGGVDTKGIIYYGKAKNLWRRLNNFMYRVKGTEKSPHSGAEKYVEFFSKTRWFEDGLMRFCWTFCKSEKKAKELESKLIRKYRKKFMDKPPLNSIG